MFNRLQGSKVMRQSGVETLITEEPDDRIGHVRICGGDGQQWLSLPGGSRKSAQAIDSSSYMKKVLITNKVTSGTPPAFFSLRYLNQSLASWRLLLVHIFFAPYCVF